MRPTWIRLICAIGLFLLHPVWADEAPARQDRGEEALQQALTDLRTDAVLMSVAAHPDDEDNATLTYARRALGALTVTVIVTSGEGGQNETGPELYEELGVIRTWETLRAAQVYGAKVEFLRLRDFGFSKTPQEAMDIWGHDVALERIVAVIRRWRPDVIITNHDTESGHGHHRAVGLLLLEAFDAAADPQRFPELAAAGLEPWASCRLLVRRSNAEGADVILDVGQYDPVRGLSYAELGNEGLKEHRSQGMDFPPGKGRVLRYFELARSRPAAGRGRISLLDGLPSLWTQVRARARQAPPALGRTLTARIDRLLSLLTGLRNHDRRDREGLVRDAANALDLLRSLRTDLTAIPASRAERREWERRLTLWEDRLGAVIAQALNLQVTVQPRDVRVVPGQVDEVVVQAFNGGPLPVADLEMTLGAPQNWRVQPARRRIGRMAANEPRSETFAVTVPAHPSFNVPAAHHLYDPGFVTPQLEGTLAFRVGNTLLRLTARARLEVAPPFTVRLQPDPLLVLLPLRKPAMDAVIEVANHRPLPLHGSVRLIPPPGWQMGEAERIFLCYAENARVPVRFHLSPPGDIVPGVYPLEVRVEGDGVDPLSLRLPLRVVEAKVVPGLRVGWVRSYDDACQNAFEALGVDYRLLDAEALQSDELDDLDTIVVDVRAYLARPELAAYNQRLLDWARRGGHLVVMYHKTGEWKPEYAPYPLVVGRGRVTQEDAPVEMVEPNHPLFRFPNCIGTEEWEGWVQERGLYFAAEWAPEYQPLLACHDPGEPPLLGGHLFAHYGEGSYLYTAYVWYRQLRAGVPGAYRLFANFLRPARRAHLPTPSDNSLAH